VSSRLVVRTNCWGPLCVRTELLDLGAGVLRVAAAPPSGGEKSTALWLALNRDNLMNCGVGAGTPDLNPGVNAVDTAVNHPLHIRQACRDAGHRGG
jgi:hypothetical protein